MAPHSADFKASLCSLFILVSCRAVSNPSGSPLSLLQNGNKCLNSIVEKTIKGKRQSSQHSAGAQAQCFRLLCPSSLIVTSNNTGCCQGQCTGNQASHILGLQPGLQLQLSGLVLHKHTKRRKTRRTLVHREPCLSPVPPPSSSVSLDTGWNALRSPLQTFSLSPWPCEADAYGLCPPLLLAGFAQEKPCV